MGDRGCEPTGMVVTQEGIKPLSHMQEIQKCSLKMYSGNLPIEDLKQFVRQIN